MTTRPISRRTALKVGAAFTAPLFLPGRLRALASANDAIRIGCIGTGRMGRGDMFSLLDRGLDPALNARAVPELELVPRRPRATRKQHGKKEQAVDPQASA